MRQKTSSGRRSICASSQVAETLDKCPRVPGESSVEYLRITAIFSISSSWLASSWHHHYVSISYILTHLVVCHVPTSVRYVRIYCRLLKT